MTDWLSSNFLFPLKMTLSSLFVFLFLYKYKSYLFTVMAEAAVDVEATSEEFQDAAEEVENEEPKNSTFTMENGKTDM